MSIEPDRPIIRVLLATLLVWLGAIANPIFPQMVIHGQVIDHDTEVPLSYVNIGIKKKNIGTSTRPNGSFTLLIGQDNTDDTLTFSLVGYQELSIPIRAFQSRDSDLIEMEMKVVDLGAITITGQKLVEKRYGIKSSFAVLHFTDGSTNQDDVFEIAQVIKLDDHRARITSVNLLINGSRRDSATFRVNFYALEDGRPGKRLVEQSIVQTHAIKEGWLKFDLMQHDIYLKGTFVVSIEFLPSQKKNDPIYYEIKIGGGSKSLVRHNSQAEWSIPPHHYKLHITALVLVNKTGDRPNEQEIDEERETTATTILYSEAVKDSFHLFIHVPEIYEKDRDRSYPVIYLLDANVYFEIVRDEMLRHGSKAILVGIGYRDFLTMDSLRVRDYTFPALPVEDSLPNSGGAPAFLTFIHDELQPYLNRHYRTDTTDSSLMGHSLGGYFTLFILEQALSGKAPHFKYYIAASPSMHYSDGYLLQRFIEVDHQVYGPEQTLYLTMGAREDAEDGGTGTDMSDQFQLLVRSLSDPEIPDFKFKTEVFPALGHMETAIPTFTKAVQLIGCK